tara:strand:+ start:167 stop:412 length:246 start_codon:yes stop_codon:yes gene_type:complete
MYPDILIVLGSWCFSKVLKIIRPIENITAISKRISISREAIESISLNVSRGDDTIPQPTINSIRINVMNDISITREIGFLI